MLPREFILSRGSEIRFLHSEVILSYFFQTTFCTFKNLFSGSKDWKLKSPLSKPDYTVIDYTVIVTDKFTCHHSALRLSKWD